MYYGHLLRFSHLIFADGRFRIESELLFFLFRELNSFVVCQSTVKFDPSKISGHAVFVLWVTLIVFQEVISFNFPPREKCLALFLLMGYLFQSTVASPPLLHPKKKQKTYNNPPIVD